MSRRGLEDAKGKVLALPYVTAKRVKFMASPKNLLSSTSW